MTLLLTIVYLFSSVFVLNHCAVKFISYLQKMFRADINIELMEKNGSYIKLERFTGKVFVAYLRYCYDTFLKKRKKKATEVSMKTAGSQAGTRNLSQERYPVTILSVTLCEFRLRILRSTFPYLILRNYIILCF